MFSSLPQERASSKAASEASQAAGGVKGATTPAMTRVSPHTSQPPPSSACVFPPSPSVTQVSTLPQSPFSTSVVAPPRHSSTLADSPSCSVPTTRPAKRRKQSDPAEELIRVAVQKLSSLRAHHESDAYVDYGRLVGSELKAMKDIQRNLTVKLIKNVIHLGNMEMLTLNHRVLQVMGSNS